MNVMRGSRRTTALGLAALALVGCGATARVNASGLGGAPSTPDTSRPRGTASVGPPLIAVAAPPVTAVVAQPPRSANLLPPVPVPTSALACPAPGWSLVNSGAEARSGGPWTWLNSVAIITAADAWAVGGHSNPNDTLIDHWDGQSWSVVASPNPGSAQELLGVSASGPNDVWAVGYQDVEGGLDQPLVEHWDGTAWSVTPTPNVGPDTRLEGVSAISATDAWAVGQQQNGTASAGRETSGTSSDSGSGKSSNTGSEGPFTVIEHWDGHAWSLVPTPSLPTPEGLSAVGGDGPDDVWAVGFDGGAALAEHWDGQSWSIVPAGVGRLAAVAVVSAADAWVVGASTSPLVERWNGKAWSAVANPNPPGSNVLLGVAALSDSDVWAVGESAGPSANETLVEHWDGVAWSIAPSPSPDHDDRLAAVAGAGPDDIWAVGVAGWAPGVTEPAPGALVERRCAHG